MEQLSNSHKYDDIIGLPHPVSVKHPRMAREDRAAQFSPFAALTGYDAAISETQRLTEKRRELDENKKAELDAKMADLVRQLDEHPTVRITYFKEDDRKDGGAILRQKVLSESGNRTKKFCRWRMGSRFRLPM